MYSTVYCVDGEKKMLLLYASVVAMRHRDKIYYIVEAITHKQGWAFSLFSKLPIISYEAKKNIMNGRKTQS
jgi:hypothetical protein